MTELPRCELGSTGVRVSRLGFGSMELRDAPRRRAMTEREVERLLHAVLDHGIDLIDTSIDYGLSEERIGRHLKDRRDRFFLASKCGCPVGIERTPLEKIRHDHSASNVRAGVEQSLRRLRTDHLDLVQIHSSPAAAVLEREGTVEELQRLRDEGKVRFIGMSGTLPHLEDHLALDVFDVFQIPYSLLEPEHAPLIERAAAAGVGILVRGATGRGVPAGSRASRVAEQLLDLWDRTGLDDLRGTVPASDFALRWALGNQSVDCFIVGTSQVAHLEANIRAVQAGPLPEELLEQAAQRVTDALASSGSTGP